MKYCHLFCISEIVAGYVQQMQKTCLKKILFKWKKKCLIKKL